MFVTDASRQSEGQRIFTAPAGRHAHFPLVVARRDGPSTSSKVRCPDQLDIWRISADGGPAERITSHNGRVSHPVLLNRRTLVYLASDPDGSGPWLHSVDVERRIPHRLSTGVDRYDVAGGERRRTPTGCHVASPRRTLWRLPIDDSPPASPRRCADRADDGNRVLTSTRPRLSACMSSDDARQREYLEARRWQSSASSGPVREPESSVGPPLPRTAGASRSRSGIAGGRSCTSCRLTATNPRW